MPPRVMFVTRSVYFVFIKLDIITVFVRVFERIFKKIDSFFVNRVLIPISVARRIFWFGVIFLIG